MINLEFFIKQCEKDLILDRNLSDFTLTLVHKLSDKNKILCEPILNFIGRMKSPIDIKVNTKEFEFLSEERILICRLIPLTMSLDTDTPTWSSYMLRQAIQAANKIDGIKISEIIVAFLEIFREFKTPLNNYIYYFCKKLSIEFVVFYRKQFDELEILDVWENDCHNSIPSVALLRFWFTDSYNPEFILETMIILIENELFKEIFESLRHLFDDLEYKQEFLKCLNESKLSRINEDLILYIVNLEYPNYN